MNITAQDFGQPEPRFRMTLIRREDRLTLEELLQKGLKVPATHGPMLKVTFSAGEPQRVRKTGWSAVKVKSSFGGESVLLAEDLGVSGILRLRR